MKYLIAMAIFMLASPVLACPGKDPQAVVAPHIEPASVGQAIAPQGPKG
jgi:hypothetical protein